MQFYSMKYGTQGRKYRRVYKRKRDYSTTSNINLIGDIENGEEIIIVNITVDIL